MKKLLALLLIGSFALNSAKAQEKLKIFKFDPLNLATSSLSFGIESFNEDRSRSMEFHLGVRYKKGNDNNYYGQIYDNRGNNIEQFSDWKGVTASLERRFYVPAFKDRKANWLNQGGSQSGVYFAPSLRVDFNQHDYDNSYYNYIYKGDEEPEEYELITNTGKMNYIGVMPALNFGVQFSIFQYAYLDLHVGGGVRIQSENEIEKTNTGNNGNYYPYGNSTISNFVIKEGVQPTGGITIGLKL